MAAPDLPEGGALTFYNPSNWETSDELGRFGQVTLSARVAGVSLNLMLTRDQFESLAEAVAAARNLFPPDDQPPDPKEVF